MSREPPRVEAKQRRLSRALWAAWWRNLAVWVALLVLLFASLGLAYVPLGRWNSPLGIAIALVKAGLVAALFMNLARAGALIRLTAATGFLFVAILFLFTFSDLFTRI